MKNNVTNSSMNVEDYENMAVQNSNTAKRVAAGAALFVGGAAVAGGAAYAASGTHHSENTDETPLTSEDLVDGGNVGNEYQQPEVHEETENTTTTTERVVYVERPAEPVHQNVESNEPTVTWDDSTVYYDADGNVIGSVENGTVQGHKFTLLDVDGDNHADYLAVDADGNGRYDDNEIVKYEVSDHVHMGHATAHNNEVHYDNPYGITENNDDLASNDDKNIIHNDFEDEKTGESYDGDYAENNSDYNSQAGMSQYDDSEYLADNEDYGSYEEDNSYSAGVNEEYMTADESYDSEEPESNDALAYEEEEDDSYDSNDYAYTDDDAANDDMMDAGEDALV